ncbi:MAG: J domain-containing protein [Spirochaetaceae bacterium]|nr:MAG: J domain-containing protein [Spirochaetaceae bacterium]
MRPESEYTVETYYSLLRVDVDSTREEIKRGFRRRAKELHPDVRSHDKNAADKMRTLIHAYETLMDPIMRRQYDLTHRIMPAEFRFDYRAFLRAQTDATNRSKLIFFELLHSNPDDAIEIYESLLRTVPSYDLSEYMDREDYMDCAFLLAEEYERRDFFVRAYELYVSTVILEFESPYFRHFFEDVTSRLRSLVCHKMPGEVPVETASRFLTELLSLPLPRKDIAMYHKRLSEIFIETEQYRMAERHLKKALALDKKLAGAKKIREKLDSRVAVRVV